MHSPIIYLIENDSDFAESMKGQLPHEYFPYEEYLLDYIDEADWLVANTLEEKNWHRNQWNDEFIDMYKQHRYFNLKQHKDNHLELEITKENIKCWDKDLLALTKKIVKGLEGYCAKNIMAPRFLFDNIDDYFNYNDMIGKSHGGERFVVYKSYKDELDLYRVVSMETLIEDVRLRLQGEAHNKITYQLCQNIVGDYHY
uniref:Uncharacterized protein n=1 Tax=Staphylococcus staphylolyticus TaxID=1287 RepID=D3X7K7_STAST|nr:hypothetical protein [Staphylococcus simulans]ADD24879.1 hypothetical protein [Staphylococcus simulans bv. staphylolyticus]ADD24928.1 hypothetical protein [Staphylococcus simulans bv. staphylolyticus]